MRTLILIATMVTSTLMPLAHAEESTPYSTKGTTIGMLMDDPEAAAIVKKHIPIFAEQENTDGVRPYTLYSLKNHSPNDITDEALKKIDAELAALGKGS